jgi:MYXO-CTERM domain-containing protein
LVLLAWSGTASAQSYPLRRPQTPNTWNRPNSTCPPAAANPSTLRVFNVMKIRVPSAAGNQNKTVTVTRTSGTGIGIDVYQGFFGGAGFECVNSYGSTYSTSNTATFTFAFLNNSGADNYFDLVISGNSGTDTGAFTITVGGSIGHTVDCSTNYFSPTSQTGISGGGGSFSTSFTPGPGCNTWTMSGRPAWITGWPANGSGAVTINYTVAANTGAARTANITGGTGGTGTSFEVRQLAGTVTCNYSLPTNSANVGTAGGARSFSVSASNSGCGWTAKSNASWITGVTASGTGNGTVNYTVAANTGAARSGTITAAGQTFTVNQAHGCTVSVAPTSSIGAAGGVASFAVTTGAGCPWTAGESTTWLSGVTANGKGSGNVSYTAGANVDAARSGVITVTNSLTGATAQHTVNQVAGCSIVLTPSSATPGNAGGTTSFNVATGAGCAWTATETSPWLSGVTPSGTNSGAVNYTVAANPGIARSAGIQVTATATGNSATFSITQGDGCTASLDPTHADRNAGAGSGNFTVTMSSPTCPWTATSNAGFITGVTPSGTGNGTINYSVTANNGVARSGTITVNGQTFTVNQANGCSATLNPVSAAPSAAGGNASFSIQMSSPSCPWTASSATPWLTGITASGTGNAVVNYGVQANAGPARSGTITAGGDTFTVNQGSGCTVSLPATTGNVGDAGGSSSFVVNTPAGCGYTVTDNALWLTATVTPTGVNYTALPSLGASRSGTITVKSSSTASSATFTVKQAPGCVLSLVPNSATASAAGGAASVGVSSGAGCTWTAATDDAWLLPVSVTAIGVNYSVGANSGPSRDGTIVLTNPQTGDTTDFTVTQASGCSVSLPVTTGTAPAAGGNASFSHTTGAGCVVTASSTASWLTNLTANAGTTSYSAAENTGIARSGVVKVTTADTGSTASFTVNQGDGCTVTLPVASGGVAQSGGASTFVVTTGAGCTYTATSPDAWLSGIQATATGVSFTADANPSLARTGTIVVTNVTSSSTTTFTVNQDGPVVMPVITQQPVDVTVDEGSPFSLSVTATGGSLAYQWRKEGVDIPGANAATFTKTSSALDDAGSYDVVVTNPAGSVTSTIADVVVRPRSAPDGGTSGVADAGGGFDAGQGDAATGNGFTPAGSGCGCELAGTNPSTGWFAAVGLGLAFAFASARRRRS